MRRQIKAMFNRNYNSVKKIIVTAIVFTLMFFASGINLTSAVGESQQIKDCPIDQRLQNWGNFLQSMVSYESFTEGFKDIFVRNFCHQYDIDILLGKMDKTREQIRKAFYTCKNDKVTQLRATYQELYVELSYLRGFIKYESGEVMANPGVQAELVDLFVNTKEWYDVDTFLEMYSSIEAKYNMDKYLNCEDDVWAELIAKWEEFKETFSDPAAKLWDKNLQDRWAKVSTTPPGKTGGFWDNRVGFYLNDVPPEYGSGFFSGLFSEEELKNVKKGVLDNMPTIGLPESVTKDMTEQEKEAVEKLQSKEVPISDILKALKSEEEKYVNNVGVAQMIAEYTFLYSDTSESIINQLIAKLSDTYAMEDKDTRAKDDKGKEIPQGLDAIIKYTTTPILDEVKVCSTQIRDKQCKN